MLAVLAAVLALGAWVSASAGEAFPATQLTNNSYDDYSGAVSGDRVVWNGFDGSDSEVYTWTPAAGTVRLTNNAYDDFSYSVSGDRVVWTCDESTVEVYTWKAGDVSPTNISTTSDSNYAPCVSGDRVVWHGVTGSDWEIFTWKKGDAAPTNLSNSSGDDFNAVVSGDRVVWESFDGSYWEVYTWKVGDSSPTKVVDNIGAEPLPQVSGDRVVWDSWSADWETGDVYTWTPGSGVVKLSTDGASMYGQVSGERVVWESTDLVSENWDSEICTWTPAGGVVRLTNNDYEDVVAAVSGDRVAWTQEVWDYGAAGLSSTARTSRIAQEPSALQAGSMLRIAPVGPSGPLRSSVFTWTPTGGVVQAASYAAYPSVSGDRLVWDSFDPNGVQDTEVSTAVAHTRCDDKNSKITYLPGWSRWDSSGYWAAVDDTYAYTDRKGDKVMVTFEGTALYWVACTSNTKGKALVRLYDGELPSPGNLVSTSTIDLYSASTKWKQRVYSTGTMADGIHTLVIECLGEKRAGSGWYTIDVDGFDVLGTLLQSPTVSKVDDKDYSQFTYTPGIGGGASTSEWSRWDSSGYYAAFDDTYAYTDQVGYKASFTFDGAYAAWVACTSNTKGKAQVKLYDGPVDPGNLVSTTEVDLYSPTTKWKQTVYDTGMLSPGIYTVIIECLGTKNPASWYHTIDVDRFDAIIVL